MSDEDINEKNDKAENIADPVTEAQEENQPETLSPEEDASRDPNRPIDVRFALRINISDRDLSKMVSVYRGIAIKTSVISAVLLLITCILPSLSDEDMVFPYSMLFWFVLILTAVRTIASVRDIMRDKEYYLQKMAIAAIISEDKDKDANAKDGNSDAEVDDRRPEISRALRQRQDQKHCPDAVSSIRHHLFRRLSDAAGRTELPLDLQSHPGYRLLYHSFSGGHARCLFLLHPGQD